MHYALVEERHFPLVAGLRVPTPAATTAAHPDDPFLLLAHPLGANLSRIPIHNSNC